MSGSSPAAKRAADGSRLSSPQSRVSTPHPHPDPNPDPNPNPNPDPDPDPDPDPIPHSPFPTPHSRLPISLPIYAIMRKDILQKDTFRKMGCSV